MSINKNEKNLVICENKEKAKTILNILKENGYINTSVFASMGPIASLADARDSVFNTGIYPQQQFKLNLQVLPEKYKIINEINQKVAEVQTVIFCTDDNWEGHAIADTIIKFLDIPINKCVCVVTHEVTASALLKAFEQPVVFNQNMANAEYAQICTNKLIGYSLSSFARKYIGVKSIGRFQSIGLLLLAERENEIINFLPKVYYDLYLTFKKNDNELKARYLGYKNEKIEKLASAQEVKAIKYQCAEHDFIIEDVQQKTRYERPPLPFCTATFLQVAEENLDVKVAVAMNLVQKLYNTGFCTYPQTESTEISNAFELELKHYIKATYNSALFEEDSTDIDSRASWHDIQECLRVTNIKITPTIFARTCSDEALNKIYNLIWQRTIAAIMPKAAYIETTYIINNNEHRFCLMVPSLKKCGYKIIYASKPENDIEAYFKVGDTLSHAKIQEIKNIATPPERYTEASLITRLQESDIERPATFITIVETILSTTRGLANLKGKYILPTSKGLQLAAYCKRAFPDLINLKHFELINARLNMIASGDLDWLTYIDSFYQELNKAIHKNQEVGLAINAIKICPKCGAQMIMRRSRFGKLFYGCPDYPKCTGILNLD